MARRAILTASAMQVLAGPDWASSGLLAASRFPCEHLRRNCSGTVVSRIHAQVPVVTTGKLTKAFRQHVSGGIEISIMVCPALRTEPCTLIQPQYIEFVPTYRAQFAGGIPAIHFDEDFPVPTALIRELLPHFTKCRVVDGPGVKSTSESFYVQVFDTNHIELANEMCGEKVQIVLPHLANPCVRSCHSQSLSLTPSASLLPPGQAALLLPKVPEASTKAFRIGDLHTGGQSREMSQTDINPNAPLLIGKLGSLDVSAETYVVPPRRVARKRDQVRAFDFRKRFGKLEARQFRETQDPTLPSGAYVLKSQTYRSNFALESRIPGSAAEEVPICNILIAQAAREACRRHLGEPFVSSGALPVREPTRDLITCNTQAALVVRRDPNAERRVPQPASSSGPATNTTTLDAVGVCANPEASNYLRHDRILTSASLSAQRRNRNTLLANMLTIPCTRPQGFVQTARTFRAFQGEAR